MSATTDFIKKHTSSVLNATKGTGIFPSVKMAQMIIESAGKDEKGNWAPGNGITARKANNFFGIKDSKNWKGPKMAFNTPKDNKPVNYFRVYPTVTDSIKDHNNFLKVNSRYEKAGVFKAKTPLAQADALAKAGYSEKPYPAYRNGIMTIIRNFNLEELDKLAGVKGSGGSLSSDLKTLGIVWGVCGAVYIASNKIKAQRA